MDRLIAAGFKTIGAWPSADGAGTSVTDAMKAAEFYFKKINERPDRYQIVRTVADIDNAVAAGKLGLYFTNQGTSIFEGDPDWVAFWRQLGYGYCLLSYNGRNQYGGGCFEPDNGRLTTVGKILVEAYNRYGMIVDVSHTGERTSLDAREA
jgi:membrane dipeptidase